MPDRCMTKSLGPILAPLVIGALLGGLLRVSGAISVAQACSCAFDGFWVVNEVRVEGPAVPWPSDGHLYPDRLELWADGLSIEVPYSP
jgi:hypothetical protein